MGSPTGTSSDRVSLRPVAWDAVGALVGGRRLDDWAPDYPDAGDLVVGRVLRAAGRAALDRRAAPWVPYQVVERASGLVVGGIGFLRPPTGGRAEIGYGIVASRRGIGVATEALGLVLALAWADRSGTVTAVTARTEPANRASQRVLEKGGFTLVEQAGTLVYEHRRPGGRQDPGRPPGRSQR